MCVFLLPFYFSLCFTLPAHSEALSFILSLPSALVLTPLKSASPLRAKPQHPQRRVGDVFQRPCRFTKIIRCKYFSRTHTHTKKRKDVTSWRSKKNFFKVSEHAWATVYNIYIYIIYVHKLLLVPSIFYSLPTAVHKYLFCKGASVVVL